MIKDIIIREVTLEDNSSLEKMIKLVFEEHNAPKEGTIYSDPTTANLFQLFRKSNSILLVAENDGQIIGCCGIYPTDGLNSDTAELVKFYLLSDFRGKGIGKLLMKKSILAAQIFGYKTIYLESLPQFSKAVAMYEKLGFQKLTHPLGNSGHSACDIWMRKDL